MAFAMSFSCPQCGEPVQSRTSSLKGDATRAAHVHLVADPVSATCVNGHGWHTGPIDIQVHRGTAPVVEQRAVVR